MQLFLILLECYQNIVKMEKGNAHLLQGAGTLWLLLRVGTNMNYVVCLSSYVNYEIEENLSNWWNDI